MAKFKDASIGESLEKCFPLKIVGVDSIPMPYQFVDLEKLSLDETNNLLKFLKKDFVSDKPLTLADIYNIDSDEVRITKEKKQIGFQ